MADELLVEREGAVAVLTLNRPRVLNAMDTPTWRALDAALDRVAAGADLEAALAMEAELAVLSLLSEDHREGARAFLEKREPRFVGG